MQVFTTISVKYSNVYFETGITSNEFVQFEVKKENKAILFLLWVV